MRCSDYPNHILVEDYYLDHRLRRFHYSYGGSLEDCALADVEGRTDWIYKVDSVDRMGKDAWKVWHTGVDVGN